MSGPLYFPSRAHLLLCTGPRCTRRGARRVFDDAWQGLEQRSLAYYKRGGSIRLTESGCLGACSYGPTLVAYCGTQNGALEAAWYTAIDAPSLLAIATALHEGKPPPDDDKRYGPR